MAYRSSTGNSTSAASSVITKPAGTVSGDVIILAAITTGSTNDITFPAGFTEFEPIVITTASYTTRAEAAWKVAGGSEPASYTIGGTDSKISAAITFSGRSANPISANSVNVNSTTVASPFTITTDQIYANTSDDVLFIGFFRFNAAGEAAVGVTTPPSGLILDQNVTVASGRGISFAHRDNIYSGHCLFSTTGVAGTFNDRSAVTAGMLVALKPLGPIIKTQPANTIARDGFTGQFSVDAVADTGNLSYQWQTYKSSQWNNIGDSNSSTYITPPVSISANNGDIYRVNVTDGAGSVVSSNAYLNVYNSTFKQYGIKNKMIIKDSGLLGNSSGTTSSMTFNVASPFSVGSKVILCVSGNFGGSGTTISSANIAGTIATKDASREADLFRSSYIFSANVANPGSTSIVLNFASSAAVTGIALAAHEWILLGDKDVSANTVESTTTSPNVTTSATTTSNQMVYAVITTTGNPGTTTLPAGYTTMYDNMDANPYTVYGSAVYREVSSKGTQDATWTLTNSTSGLLSIATYKILDFPSNAFQAYQFIESAN